MFFRTFAFVMKKYIKPIVATLMAVVFFAAYMSVYEYVIYFHEQHHLFRFTADYWAETVHQHGLWWILTEFVVQFGYYPWLAALVWTAMEVGVYLFAQGAVRRLTGKRDLLQVSAIPAVWMFFNTTDVDTFPTLAVKIFIGVIGLWLLSVLISSTVGAVKSRYRRSLTDGGKCGKLQAVGSILLFPIIFAAGYAFSTAPRSISLGSGKYREQSRSERIAQRTTERMMINAERALKNEDWDKLYDITLQQAATGKKNHLMTYFRAMALYNKGMLLTNLFDFPQTFGANSLFFPWKSDRNQAEFGGYIYEQLGAINSANHWAFEALVGWGETAWHLTNLARYSIASGKTEQARKFIAPLKNTLFYRSTARRLEAEAKEGRVAGLRNSLADVKQEPARWDNVFNLGADLRYILLADPENQMAREYIVAYFLMANNLGAFYRNLCEFWPQPQNGYLPPIVEQGLCLVRMQIGAAQLAADGYRISPETERLFNAFLAEMPKEKMARFTPEMRRTYWYYVQKVSPYGKELVF